MHLSEGVAEAARKVNHYKHFHLDVQREVAESVEMKEASVDSSSVAAAADLVAVGLVDWAPVEVPSDCMDQTVEDTNLRVPLHVEASNLCHLH